MVDVFDESKRSLVMAGIRSTGSRSTELLLRTLFECHGVLGWVEHDASLPGKPDFTFTSEKVAVFVDGCFWHGCPHCADGHTPKSNEDYWSRKIGLNKQRDRQVSRALRGSGWSVVRIWECRLKANSEGQVRRVIRKVREKGSIFVSIPQTDASILD